MAHRTRETRTDNKAQVAAFRKAARELGCEDNEEQFKDALRTVAKAKPSEKNPAPKAKRSRSG